MTIYELIPLMIGAGALAGVIVGFLAGVTLSVWARQFIPLNEHGDE